MSVLRSIRLLLAAALAWSVAGVAWGQEAEVERLQQEVSDLRIRNRTLEKSLAEANRAEKQASGQLARIRGRLEALGADVLEGGDDRLIEATADIQVLNDRVTELEERATRFAGAVSDYLRHAVAADPDARLRVERNMRELDEVLGLRQKPAPASRTNGSARRAKVMSIDAESGLLVLNVGEKQDARIGTTYRLRRGDQAYGTAIVADVRDRIAGAFVESLEPGAGPVRLGDIAILETE